MLITQEMKENAIDLIQEMGDSLQQPDTDDLHYIRNELKRKFEKVLVALGKRRVK